MFTYFQFCDKRSWCKLTMLCPWCMVRFLVLAFFELKSCILNLFNFFDLCVVEEVFKIWLTINMSQMWTQTKGDHALTMHHGQSYSTTMLCPWSRVITSLNDSSFQNRRKCSKNREVIILVFLILWLLNSVLNHVDIKSKSPMWKTMKQGTTMLWPCSMVNMFHEDKTWPCFVHEAWS